MSVRGLVHVGLSLACCVASLASCRAGAVSSTAGSASPDSMSIRRNIEYLASEKLAGRLTGTPGNDSAAAYLAGWLRHMAA